MRRRKHPPPSSQGAHPPPFVGRLILVWRCMSRMPPEKGEVQKEHSFPCQQGSTNKSRRGAILVSSGRAAGASAGVVRLQSFYVSATIEVLTESATVKSSDLPICFPRWVRKRGCASCELCFRLILRV